MQWRGPAANGMYANAWRASTCGGSKWPGSNVSDIASVGDAGARGRADEDVGTGRYCMPAERVRADAAPGQQPAWRVQAHRLVHDLPACKAGGSGRHSSRDQGRPRRAVLRQRAWQRRVGASSHHVQLSVLAVVSCPATTSVMTSSTTSASLMLRPCLRPWRRAATAAGRTAPVAARAEP